MAYGPPTEREQVYRAVTRALSKVEAEPWAIFDESVSVIEQVARIAASRFVIGTAAATESAVEIADLLAAGVTAITSAFGLLVLIAALDALLLVGVFHGTLRAVLSKAPLGIGGKLASLTDAVFAWDKGYAHWVAEHIVTTLIGAIIAVKFVIGATLGLVHVVGGTVHILNPLAVPKAIINEVHALTTRISRLEHEIYDAGKVVANVPGSLAAQLHSIHTQVSDLYHKGQWLLAHVDNLYNDHHALAHEVHSLEHLVGDLQHRLTGVRAIHVSAPDLIGQLEGAINGIDSRIGSLEGKIGITSQQVTQLMPLTMLLTGGLVGLRMLRTLEDEPCQCAPSEKVTISSGGGDDLFGLYELVSNG